MTIRTSTSPAQPTVQPSVETVAKAIHSFTRRGLGHEYLDLQHCTPTTTNTGASCASFTRLAAEAVLALIGGRTEREVLAQGWDEGVAIALDRAVRQDDGIPLKLEYLNGTPIPNPYRSESDHGE